MFTEYIFIGLALAFGLIAFSALCLSVFSYNRLSGHMELVVKLLRNTNKELSTLEESVDAVLIQNKESIEQDRKIADHQRVLLASLNRQLYRLEEFFQETEATVNEQAAQVALQRERAARERAAREKAARIAAAAAAQQSAQASVAPQPELPIRPAAAVNDEWVDTGEQVRASDPGYAPARRPASAHNHQTLESIVEQPIADSPTGARIPLEQRIRIHRGMQQRSQGTETAGQTKSGPVIRTRETIDVLKMKERRVANG